MVTYANDDAYEWFGGSVNHKYLIAYSTIDDDLDTDRGYNGKIQYGLIVRDPMIADFSGARAWESSSFTQTTAPTVGGIARHSAPKFSHVTVVGPLLFRTSAQINQFYRAALEIDRQLKRLLRKYPSLKADLRKLGVSLSTNPIQGVSLGNQCYKIRLAVKSKNKGKSGGARVISYVYLTKETVYLLSIYDKSEQPDISDKELTTLVHFINTSWN